MEENKNVPAVPGNNKKTVAKIVKTVIIVLVAAAILVGAGLGGLYYMGKTRAMPSADAIAIAVADAGVDPASTVVKCHLGRDEGMFCYKIELYSAGTEYEYSIHSETGAIIERDVDRSDSDRDGHDDHDDHDHDRDD